MRVRRATLAVVTGAAVIALVLYQLVIWIYATAPIRGLGAQYDQPFSVGCQEPDLLGPRANATILMLARNSDLDGAVQSIMSLERHFNRWYKYPYTFLNNEEFSEEFKDKVRNITKADCEFGLIPKSLWEFPKDVSDDLINEALLQQSDRSLAYGGLRSYHEMCRFFSGKFYHHPMVAKYEWYWRLEPDVSFFCDITYDPFVEMQRAGKVYGFTVFLTELKDTINNLFRHTLTFKKRLGLADTDLWSAVTTGADKKNDLELMDGLKYNQCHFWSNFEIARVDLWRNDLYQAYFDHLERASGFWYERWGDAPVHTFAVAMFLNTSQIHYFRDIGYTHSIVAHCPGNAAGRQLPLVVEPTHADSENDQYWEDFDAPRSNGVGCRCRCVNEIDEDIELAPCFQKVLANHLGIEKSGNNEYDR